MKEVTKEQFKEIYGMNAMYDALEKAIEEDKEDDEEAWDPNGSSGTKD